MLEHSETSNTNSPNKDKDDTSSSEGSHSSSSSSHSKSLEKLLQQHLTESGDESSVDNNKNDPMISVAHPPALQASPLHPTAAPTVERRRVQFKGLRASDKHHNNVNDSMDDNTEEETTTTTTTDSPSQPASQSHKSGPHRLWNTLENANKDELMDRVEVLQERLLQTQINLANERSNRKRKQKSLVKLARELAKRASESKALQQQVTQLSNMLTETKARLMESNEARDSLQMLLKLATAEETARNEEALHNTPPDDKDFANRAMFAPTPPRRPNILDLTPIVVDDEEEKEEISTPTPQSIVSENGSSSFAFQEAISPLTATRSSSDNTDVAVVARDVAEEKKEMMPFEAEHGDNNKPHKHNPHQDMLDPVMEISASKPKRTATVFDDHDDDEGGVGGADGSFDSAIAPITPPKQTKSGLLPTIMQNFSKEAREEDDDEESHHNNDTATKTERATSTTAHPKSPRTRLDRDNTRERSSNRNASSRQLATASQELRSLPILGRLGLQAKDMEEISVAVLGNLSKSPTTTTNNQSREPPAETMGSSSSPLHRALTKSRGMFSNTKSPTKSRNGQTAENHVKPTTFALPRRLKAASRRSEKSKVFQQKTAATNRELDFDALANTPFPMTPRQPIISKEQHYESLQKRKQNKRYLIPTNQNHFGSGAILIFLALLLAIAVLDFAHPELMSLNGWCGPVMPSTDVLFSESSRQVHEAPWWVADDFKSSVFAAVCGSDRPRVRLHRNEQGRIFLTNANTESEKRQHSETWPHHHHTFSARHDRYLHQHHQKHNDLFRSRAQQISMVNVSESLLFLYGSPTESKETSEDEEEHLRLLEQVAAPWIL